VTAETVEPQSESQAGLEEAGAEAAPVVTAEEEAVAPAGAEVAVRRRSMAARQALEVVPEGPTAAQGVKEVLGGQVPNAATAEVAAAAAGVPVTAAQMGVLEEAAGLAAVAGALWKSLLAEPWWFTDKSLP